MAVGAEPCDQVQCKGALLQLVIQVLPIAGGGFHPDEDLAGGASS